MRSVTVGVQPLIPRKYATAAFVALVVAGLAGNYCRYEIFFNIQFIFGSIFAMLALQVFGLGPGVLAALLSSSITWQMWNHPYAIVVMTSEVLVVGWLIRRRNLPLVIADALFWLGVGLPLGLLFSFGVMHLAGSNATFAGVKQMLNGIANALAARLIFMAVFSRSRQLLFSLRELVLNLLAAFVLVPALAILTIESRGDLQDTDRGIRRGLVQASDRATRSLNRWLDGHLSLVGLLADMAAWNTLPAMQRSLDKVRTSDQDFQRLGLLDAEAMTVAFSPLADAFGQPGIGRSYADRPFIPLLKKAVKPMLSEVVMARFGPSQPMVTLLAPVRVNGEYAGYVAGILELKGIREILGVVSGGNGTLYTLLDRNGRVIVTNRPELKPMDEFRRGSGDALALDDGVVMWVSSSRKNVPLSDRWRNSFYIKEAGVGSFSEWRLVLEQPIAPFQKLLYEQYAELLMWVLALLLAALAVGQFSSRKIVASLDQLSALSTDLPNKLAGGAGIARVESATVETGRLFENFKSMAGALSLKFAEIRELNAALETTVAERTRALQEREERYRRLTENAQDLIYRYEVAPQRGFTYVNPAATAITGFTPEEHYADPDLGFKIVHPDDIPLLQAALSKPQPPGTSLTLRWVRKDGRPIWTEQRNVPVFDGAGQLIALEGIARDITERKRAEEKIAGSLREKEVLLKEIHHRVKNNMQVIYSLLNLQAQGIADGAVRAMFEESRDRVNSMALIHENLYRSQDLAHIDFKAYLQSLVQGIASTYKRREIAVSVAMESMALDVNAGIPCGLIVNELVANSFKHAFPDGRTGTIRVGMRRNAAGECVLSVVDDGIGLPADMDFRSTASLGLQLVNVLAGQIRGKLELTRDAGTGFSVTFPAPAQEGAVRDG